MGKLEASAERNRVKRKIEFPWVGASWTNGKQIVHGKYMYNRGSDTFEVVLFRKIRNLPQIFTVYNNLPEWGIWKRIK